MEKRSDGRHAKRSCGAGAGGSRRLRNATRCSWSPELRSGRARIYLELVVGFSRG